jgi:DNA-binding PadR family transcriptional regulator
MSPSNTLGEFEQLVLLAVLRLADSARAIDVRSEIETRAERSVSRGALYSTLERLEEKGFVTWRVEDATPERGGIPRRVYAVAPAGLEALRTYRRAVGRLSEGLDEALQGP